MDDHGKELLGEFLTEVSGLVPLKRSQGPSAEASLCAMMPNLGVTLLFSNPSLSFSLLLLPVS